MQMSKANHHLQKKNRMAKALPNLPTFPTQTPGLFCSSFEVSINGLASYSAIKIERSVSSVLFSLEFAEEFRFHENGLARWQYEIKLSHRDCSSLYAAVKNLEPIQLGPNDGFFINIFEGEDDLYFDWRCATESGVLASDKIPLSICREFLLESLS
jgi:hypothetical protein